MLLPDLLFKYKALNTKEDLIRTVDIIKNHRLYMPYRKQLNDPFESVAVSPTGEAVMGASIMYAADEEPTYLENGRDEYRILALSEECFSPQMWAYYCSDYSGICMGFIPNRSFLCAKPIIYTNKQYSYNEEDVFGYDLVLGAVEKSLFIKQREWRHEKEWRIILKDKEPYFSFEENELMCIIVGYRMNDETKSFIKDITPKNIPVLVARPGMISYRLYLQPIDYAVKYDGSDRPEIRSVSELMDYCRGGDRGRWV